MLAIIFIGDAQQFEWRRCPARPPALQWSPSLVCERGVERGRAGTPRTSTPVTATKRP
jgi:hypothetical protein